MQKKGTILLKERCFFSWYDFKTKCNKLQENIILNPQECQNMIADVHIHILSQ